MLGDLMIRGGIVTVLDHHGAMRTADTVETICEMITGTIKDQEEEKKGN